MLSRSLSPIVLLAAVLARGARAATPSCAPPTFLDAPASHFGIEILDVTAEEVQGWNEFANSVPATPALPVQPRPIDFCDVKIYYTHPGRNDTVRVDVWLPLRRKDWNGRFLGQGGLGWAAGNVGALGSGVALGYATAQTNAGHTFEGHPSQVALSSSSWALTSPGNANLHQLQNFGYRCLDDLALIAKDIVQTYYKKDIAYSYWNGCSTGGRQGFELAQRYPSHFQGVLASAPAMNWATFLVTEHYGHVKMNELKYFPPACELQAITKLAVEACDEIDGVKDGIVAAHGQCKFDPRKVVGKKYACGADDKRTISKEAAEIAAAVWSGPIKNGKPVWYGLSQEAPLPGLDPLYRGLATTDCGDDNQDCKSVPFGISADYLRNWVLKDPEFDLNSVGEDLFYHLLRTSRQQYSSFMNADDPDLEPFKTAGGKIIHWHGLADQLIPPNGSLNYYQRVQEVMGKTDDFYRYYEAPGVAHCFGGDGAFPTTAIQSLVEWVEKGKAPEHLDAESIPAMSSNPQADAHSRVLCPWPQVQQYKGGDANKASSFKCAADFGKKAGKEKKHDEL